MVINKNTVIGVLGFFLIIGGGVYLNKDNFANVDPNPTLIPSEPSKYDDFAKCLAEKGAKMYGAFWCGHCQNQKAAFGASFQYVDYIECTVDGKQNSFAQVCKDAGITGYPIWKFADGTVKEGEVSMSDLAKISGCELPQ